MRHTALLSAVAIALVSASPAFAQMRTSAGAAGAPAGTGTHGVASGNEAYRPTNFLPGMPNNSVGAIQRAQVVADDVGLYGIGTPTGLNFAWGIGNRTELGWNANVLYNSAPGSVNIPLAGYGKFLLADAGPASVALGVSLGTAISNSGTPFILGGNLYLPISIWSVGPGDLHLIPALSLGLAPTFALNTGNLNVTAGYELPLNNKWRLEFGDTLTGGLANSVAIGTRVGLTPNLTADVGSLSLTFGGTPGVAINANLISVQGTWGGRVGDVRSAWGL